MYWISDMDSVWKSKLNQYFVSYASLYEIDILEEISAFDIEAMASATFAAMDVPLFNIWLDRTASFFFFLR